jgi:hypothetical protein
MTIAIVGQLSQKIRDAIDGARSGGSALARSAHEIVDCAQPEEAPTAVGTSSRADLIDRETVRVLLTGANLARLDGMLTAYGVVLRLLDDAREEEHAAARVRVESEAARDAATYIEAIDRDGENQAPEQWSADAFDSWIDDEPAAIEPLTTDEAKALYIAAFMRTLEPSQ